MHSVSVNLNHFALFNNVNCCNATPRTVKSYVPVLIVTHTGRCRLSQVRFENMA